jgi:hypothetical protein
LSSSARSKKGPLLSAFRAAAELLTSHVPGLCTCQPRPCAPSNADRYAEVQAALPRTEITVKFGDKEAKATAFETNVFQAAKAANVDKKLINSALCAIVRDTTGAPLGLVEGQWDMERPLEQDCSVELCNFETKASAPHSICSCSSCLVVPHPPPQEH